MSMVRAGITLYGLWPSDEVRKDIVPLEPVMSLRSHIIYIKEISAGTPVSYGGTWAPDHTVRLATVPVGYGDGWPRSLSNKGYVLIRGQKAPIRGRVCMDQFMVEVTDIPDAAEGDEVTLIGRDGDAYISMEKVGDLSGRFNYELACDINPRVPRVCSITQ
jgi:alanine racemase